MTKKQLRRLITAATAIEKADWSTLHELKQLIEHRAEVLKAENRLKFIEPEFKDAKADLKLTKKNAADAYVLIHDEWSDYS